MNTRLLLVAAVASAALAATASTAAADGGGCGLFSCQVPPPRYYTFCGFAGGNKGPLPTFQAAPWYLYWPYDGHFLTPAPVSGAFYGPPTAGNYPVNPYFPGQGYGAGYGQIPGGPPPRP
jgi:hypothetical protein